MEYGQCNRPSSGSSRLQAFKAFDKHGYPPNMGDMWKWNDTIQKMIDAFELMKYAHTMHDKEDNKTIEQGLDLFHRYFQYLWD